MTAAKIPSLDALPVQGVEDDLQTVIQARQKLNASFVMVEQICAAPSGLPAELRIKMNSIRFHIATGLSAIDSFLYMGYPSTSSAGEVPNLRESISNHIEAIRQARPAWNAWLATEKPPEAPDPLPVASALDPIADVVMQTLPSSALKTTSEPTPLRTYLTIGGVALGALVLWKLLD